MINFIKMKDIPFTIDSEGQFLIDKVNLYNRVAGFGLRRDVVISTLSPLVDQMIFPTVYEMSEVRDIIIDLTHRVNEVVGPIIRYEALRNERVPNYIDLGKIINKKDVVIIRHFEDDGKVAREDRRVLLMVDISAVFNKLEKTKMHFSKDEQKAITKLCQDVIDGSDLSKVDKIYDSYSEFVAERNKLRDEIFLKINERILESVEDIIHNHIIDDSCSNLYFSYDEEKHEVVYDETRVSYLLTAMGVIEDPQDNEAGMEYIKLLANEVASEIKRHFANPAIDFESMTNVPLLVNSDMINSILYAVNNEFKLSEAHNHRAPAILIGNSDIDVLFIVKCSHMLDYDKILNDVATRYCRPKSALYDHIDLIINEVQEVYKLLSGDREKDKPCAPFDVIFKSCYDAYKKMSEVVVEKSFNERMSGIYTLGKVARNEGGYNLFVKTLDDEKDLDSRARNKLL